MTDGNRVPAAGPTDGEGRRWPLQPLLASVGLTAAALPREVGVKKRVVVQAAQLGLTDVQSDRWAIRLGRHPLEVWGWDWVDAASDLDGQPTLDSSAARLRDEIEGGVFAPGTALPTLRALAEQWNVSRTTAGRVVASLRSEGLLVSSRGRPITVARDLSARAS